MKLLVIAKKNILKEKTIDKIKKSNKEFAHNYDSSCNVITLDK